MRGGGGNAGRAVLLPAGAASAEIPGATARGDNAPSRGGIGDSLVTARHIGTDMARIVRTAYRYKRPSGRKKPVAIEVSVVVKAATKRSKWQTPPPEPAGPPPPANDDGKPAPPPAAERNSAIVTIRRPSRFGVAEDLTPEERNRRADLADAMLQDFKRLIAKEGRG